MITGIEHLAIFSGNTTELKDWYIKMFDFKQVYDNGKGTYFIKAQNGFMIEFIMGTAGEIPKDHTEKGLRHVAISVSLNDFESMTKKLQAVNVDEITKPAVSDKGVGTFFFRDPDGNVLHLIARKEPL
ncbi:MAG: VOC family protein [Spirochaetaceae bacterium]|nr:VOC family protein [Spirochaetaceae bacterium]